MQVNAINSASVVHAKNSTIQIKRKDDGNWFTNWLNDKDKVCTDSQDDGKISFGEKVASFGKGLIGLVKSAIKNPIKTGLVFGLGLVATAITGGAVLPVLAALGVGMGAFQIGQGVYKAAKATTDAQAKAAWEEMGSGTFAVVTSVFGAKGALKAASKAGVIAADDASELNTVQAVGKCFTSASQALKMCGLNAKDNFLTLTAEEILANNSGVNYANKAKFIAEGILNYQDPTSLHCTRMVNTMKQIQSLFKFGVIKINSLEKATGTMKMSNFLHHTMQAEPKRIKQGLQI